MQNPRWFHLDSKTAFEELKSSEDGLADSEAAARLTQYGPNRLPEGKRRGLGAIILGQFSDFMILVLLGAALVSGLIGDLKDTLAIVVILLLNAIIGTVQEYRAQQALSALKALAAQQALVRRNGQVKKIAASQLVPGDIVLLEAGNLVPADVRLIQSETLQADESALTGESQAVTKHTEALKDKELPIGDRLNLAFKGSLITRGKGEGVVIATGRETEFGQIASLLAEEKKAKTPLQERLSTFGRHLALAVLAICAVVFVAGLLQGQPVLLMLLTAISLAVAAIPEALPAVITIALAMGARRLVKHHALVRNLPAVETLGSVTYICTDKTGTLTLNQMTVEKVFADNQLFEQSAFPDNDIGQALGKAMALNNDVTKQDEKTQGEPTELALYQAAKKQGYDRPSLEQSLPRIGAVPFDSDRKMMTTLHQDGEKVVAYSKGAPEVVLALCESALLSAQGGAWQAGDALQQAEKLANEGYRVLALACREFTHKPDDKDATAIEQQLQFIGLVALIDPPRPEVPDAVQDCLTAGIKPVMITGDHPGTALAIAKRLGICETDKVVTGTDLDTLSEQDFASHVMDIRVYARVSPAQKLRIVKALQAKGQFVAMTGDGVNDAPALKRAGIGVAMGQKGTDVARQAADMVLLDDNFATIVRAVKTGRRIFDNIRKFIKDTMSSNSGEIWTLLLAPLMGLPIPLLPIHILWINLVTDGLPGLAFSAEKAEPDVMKRRPRPPDESIFAHGMWQHIVWFGLFVGGISIASQAWAMSNDMPYWQTVVFTVLTLSQLFHSMAVRSERASLLQIGFFSNLYMIGAVTAAFLLQLAVIYHPMLNDIFYTQPLPLDVMLGCIGVSSLVLVVVEVEKWMMRHGWLYQSKTIG
ncbi:cation-translocating P-type ATPase [Aliiglaciecola sp. CAU 1673]|uniref:cation-translocating P-type ATPase n=1 Tax=Aliiglaciecola sp. CAU 1673 TaxID=3032595 RepID=UPI0023D9B03A|nr:cation-translocating P-type ATPase [Aliiglaciecola sp. CAU 1673]MDF2177624.1 cation-translocating P-type ATPase [Aliiglaciecola sp. CAU 1673]